MVESLSVTLILSLMWIHALPEKPMTPLFCALWAAEFSLVMLCHLTRKDP